jgi:hypothetical protein
MATQNPHGPAQGIYEPAVNGQKNSPFSVFTQESKGWLWKLFTVAQSWQ